VGTRPRLADTFLIADDEPYNLQWLIDYIEAIKYKVVVADTVDAALAELQRAQFRAVIADLSIPVLAQEVIFRGREPLFQSYPGLAIAESARSSGHLDRQVIVYSVYDDPLVRAYTAKIGCTYLRKGRPRQLKEEIDAVLSYDPLSHRG
jgi:CheY-like chemotaxis protein